MVKATAAAGSILAGLLAAARVQAAVCELPDLKWLAGVWRDATASTVVEERWTIAPGGRLVGSSWVLHNDRAGGVIEAITIQNDGTAVSMHLRHFTSTLDHAREDRDAPMIYVAARCEADSVTFDGQGTQAGEHMTYRRSGGTLNFAGDFLHDGRPVHAEQTFRRAAAD